MKCPKCNKKMERLELQLGLGSRGISLGQKITLQYLCENCGIYTEKKFKLVRD